MDLLDIRGIGPKKKKDLANLGIYKISDLYNYYPREYEDRTLKSSVLKASPKRPYYFEWTAISKAYTKRFKNASISYMYFEENGLKKIRVVWFNDKFSIRKIVLGKTYKFFTKVTYKNGYYQAVNPMFEELDGKNIGKIVAIYPLTAGITRKNLSSYIRHSLDKYDEDENILSTKVNKKFSLMNRKDALKEIHFPNNLERLARAKSDIKIIDLVRELCFLDVIRQKSISKQNLKLSYDLEKILSNLDFTLTKGQYRSLLEILKDLTSNITMNRLLVGDVGSGKTIVSLIVMIILALNSYQSAMMVPTELLAIQQYEKNLELFNKFNLNIALLTGSTKDKDRIKKALKAGEIDIVIGTHALIEEDVIFKKLKLVINDEQHRFGVRQRQALSLKGRGVNYLTMTATPIPRTLSLKINKLIDLSIIDELPKGRSPVKTQLVFQNRESFIFEVIKENLDKSRQVYIVSNNIDSDDDNSVLNLYKRYKKVFPSKKVSMLHGKLKPDEKEKILYDFSKGKVDILISTTVIEVGIDVSNANTMVIYNAGNFGLSQLHQLRGRVGRGPFKSFCYLVSKDNTNTKKLKTLTDTNDGFEISKKDYELRGGGKILSLIQHGKNLSEIECLNMTEDETNRSLEIFDYLKNHNFEGVNLKLVKKYFREDKEIILN